jgi:glutamyl-tRNA reductase
VESRLFVYHYSKNSKNGSKDFDLMSGSDHQDTVLFETCLRKVWLSYNDLTSEVTNLNNLNSVQTLQDDEAYAFLLEVLCGLQSPLIGETEVFGQFKNQVLKTLDSKNPLTKMIHSLVADTKNIRSQHLKNLGSSSYGSLARKHLAGFKSLDIIGAGQFVQSLKPWIEKLDIHTNVYTRSPENYASIYQDSKWTVRPTSEYTPLLAKAPKALFICAPIDMTTLDLSVYDLIIDFRDAQFLGDVSHPNMKILSEIFQEIAKDNLFAEQKKQDALVSIEQASELYITAMNHRPFGWDDLSA